MDKISCFFQLVERGWFTCNPF